MPYTEIGRGVSFNEAYLLTAQLLKDPSSAIYAAANEWDYPLSREGLVLADLFDLTVQANSSKKIRVQYPRPFVQGGKRLGRTKRSRKEVLALLGQMNPKEQHGG